MANLLTYFNIIHAYTPDTAVIGLTTISGTQVNTQWYSKKHIAKLLEAALAPAHRANVYARITPLQNPPQHGRGLEKHSLGSSVLWVDYDTYTDTLRGMQTLQNLPLPPTMVVSSGNGLHAYWLLDKFYTDLDQLKGANIALAQGLNAVDSEKAADSCYDLARVLRVPGTYNIKRTPHVEADIAYIEPKRIYTLDQFEVADIEQHKPMLVWDSANLPGDFLEALRERDTKLYKRIYSADTALRVDAPTKADKSIDRSKNDAYIATRLLGLGYTAEICLAVLMHSEWLSGSKYTETGRYDYVVTTVNSAYRLYSSSVERYFIKGSLRAEKLAEDLRTASPYIYTAEKLWRYHNGVYLPDGEDNLRALIVDKLAARWNSRAALEVVQWVTDACKVEIEQVNKHSEYINCSNGMLHIPTANLIAHSPQFLSLSQIPARYDPNVNTDAIDLFVSQIIPADTIPVFWEYVGSAFLLDRYFPKAFVALVGKRDSGKSKLLELLVLFYGGKRNVAAISLQTLADNKFASAALFGKLANIFSDLDEAEAHNTGQIKALTGDDYISGEEKFKGFFMFKSAARLWFSANHYPRVRNPDEAFFRRSVIIPCPNHFDRLTADPLIVQKLATPDNFSAMLLRAYQGLLRVLEHNDLSDSSTIHDAGADYRFTADTVSGFLHACTFDTDYAISKQKFYQAYREVCSTSGRKPVSDDLFYKRVADNLDRFGMRASYDTLDEDTRQWRYHGRKPPSTIYLNLPTLGLPDTSTGRN